MSILDKAKELVMGSRQSDYGRPADNHTRTAILWNAYLDAKRVGSGTIVGIDRLGPEDVCFLIMLQKISREMNAPKEDNLVDIAGYALNIDLIRNPPPVVPPARMPGFLTDREDGETGEVAYKPFETHL